MLALVGLVVGWFLLTGCFVLVMHVKALRTAGRLNLFWTINVLPWAALGLALDALFNAVAGTLMFAELPHEILFTARCKRWVSIANGIHPDDMNALSRYRALLAFWWQRQLNMIEPGHV